MSDSTFENCLMLAAQAWCQEDTAHIELDARLAHEFACILKMEADRRNRKAEKQQNQIDNLNKERIEWIAVTSEMESEINELKAGEDWYKNRLAELKG